MVPETTATHPYAHTLSRHDALPVFLTAMPPAFCAESWAESSVASSPRTRNASRAAARSGALISPLDSRPVALMAAYANDARSEENTSELQSLMRNSYAVFCLKKQQVTIIHNNL